MFPGGLGFDGYGYGEYGTYTHARGSLNLTVTSPVQSFAETLSLGDVKDFLAITASPQVTDDDAMLLTFISAAREVFEIEQGYDLMVKQFDMSLDYFYGLEIPLRDNLISVDLVQYRDSSGNYTTLVENTDYTVDKAKRPGVIAQTWNNFWPVFTPWPSGAVLIRFTCGLHPTDAFWNNAGARLLTGMKVLIKSWYIGDDEKGNQDGIPYASQVLMRYGAVPRVR
jgi:hypothetical protein